MDNLLDTLLKDEKKVNKSLYSAGPFWRHKNKRTIFQIKKNTLKDFRGMHSSVGTSFTDNVMFDIRNEYNFLGRAVSSIQSIPLIRKVFNSQLRITSDHINNFLKNQNIVFRNNKRVQDLISQYNFERTTEFECLQKFDYQNKEYSCHYLEMANRIDHINKSINLNDCHSLLEIGGGFAANIHFLLSNFTNLKKIIYVDVVPNIYVGTEYLKNFYEDAVIDYLSSRDLEEIKFKDNDKLEIFCLAPWQIENLNTEIDHFHNACSFVEMPKNVIENYVKYIFKNLVKSISLVSYQYGDHLTLKPDELNSFFDNKLEILEHSRVISEIGEKETYLIKVKDR